MASSDRRDREGRGYRRQRGGHLLDRLSSRTGTPRTAALAVVLSLALVIVAVAVVIPASSLWGRHSAAADREALTDVAVEVALLLSSLSFSDAETSLDRLTELSSGELREEITVRREEVLRTLDDDEVRASAEVIASGVEQGVAPRGILSGGDEPTRARLLVATRAEVRNSQTDAVAEDAAGERTWRWRLEAVIEDGRALVVSAEVAV